MKKIEFCDEDRADHQKQGGDGRRLFLILGGGGYSREHKKQANQREKRNKKRQPPIQKLKRRTLRPYRAIKRSRKRERAG